MSNILSSEYPTLDQLIPSGMFVGTSLILRGAGCFLYGMRPIRCEGDRPIIELTGIGGGLEPEDETYTTGLLREVQEEIACDVRLIPCLETLVVRGPERVERVRLGGRERPAALVFRRHRTPPHQPWHEDHAGEGCLIVYLGELAGSPQLAMELPWLLWLIPEQVLRTAREDVPLSALLEEGAELVCGPFGLPPEGSWVRLTDSQEALGLALGDELPKFYRSLGRD